jgi:dTMP kinase
MEKGMFIVFDGNDGSGKATQSKMLEVYLREKGVAAERVDFPAYDTNLFGKLIGECLAGKHGDFVTMDPKVASTLYACDRHESSAHIRELLDAGTVVIADRFTSANQIHQGGKIADIEKRKEFLEWLDTMEHEKLSIPRPDKILYLQVPLEMSLELLQKKRAQKNSNLEGAKLDTVEEDRNYLERSHESAQYLLTTQPNWELVDCMSSGEMRTVESIHQEILVKLGEV